jgi:antitoxin component YwqK of YwqJK toxin-antitoxin module
MTSRLVTVASEHNTTTTYYEVNGKIEGEQKTFYNNGDLYSLYNYIDGKKNGPFILYQENGLPMVIGNYLDDEWKGEFTYYNIKGEITNVVIF